MEAMVDAHVSHLIGCLPLFEPVLTLLLLSRSKNPPQNIYSLYNQVGINCFIAAAVYVAVGAVSLCQVRLNKRQEYMVT